MNIAQVGLTLNPVSKYAYLIPRYNGATKQMECVLEPSYIGLSKLLTDSGSVKSIECHIIYEGDSIKVDMASDQKIISHVPYFLNGKDKGGILGVYSNATLADGKKHVEMMSFVELHEIRDRSESYKAYVAKKIPACTWTTDEGEMCRKTIIKRHSKYLPKSEQTTKFDQAVDLDNQVNGFREPMDFGMLQFLESSIDRSTINPDRKAKLKMEMSKWEYKSAAYKLMEELSESMPIMGRDVTPHTVKEQKEAIQYSVAKDDFYERKK
jgi:phage RecT family recombinase